MEMRINDEKLTVGTTELILPGYSVIEPLGSGANANVFLVHNRILDRNEALKVWKPRLSYTLVDEKQFYAELRKNAIFTGNDSIATIHTGGCQSGIYYCIMEYCPGVTLTEFLSGNPSWLYRWGLARQISDTMKSIYSHGVFHGDLHSNNIIIDVHNSENWLKILDLGTSIFSGGNRSHKRDAKLLYNLSFQLLPLAKDLAFYCNDSISALPSPLLNQAFRAVVNISDPVLTEEFDINHRPHPDSYLPPDYHNLPIWEIASMVHTTPVFLLPLVEKFLYDFGYDKIAFYKELHKCFKLDSYSDEKELVECVSQEYAHLSSKYVQDYVQS